MILSLEVRLIVRVKEQKEVDVIKIIKCDICGKEYSPNQDFGEVQEFIHIKEICGYYSEIGDGYKIDCDICQHCLKEKLGKYLKITGPMGEKIELEK